MLIKSLRMENFRQFKGHTRVEFACDPEQNVTIILGDNTFGKTTLLQAFSWCFYGTVVFPENPDFLLNLEVSAEMKEDGVEPVEVEIVLEQNGVEYVVTRTQNYYCKNGKVKGEAVSKQKVSYKQADGQMEAIKDSQVKNVINNILPEELSSYFFFDTERVNSISTRKDVAGAVKGLLGLTILDNAVKHLGSQQKGKSVIGQLYNSMDLDGDEKAQTALDQMHTAERKREQIAEKLEQTKSEIKSYEDQKEQLDAILRDNQTTANLQQRKETNEANIAVERNTLNSTTEFFFKDFNNGALSFFAQPLMEKAKAFLVEVKVDDKGVRDLTKPTIMELINRGKCVCGREIVEGNEAYQHLMEELAFVPPESIGNTVRHYRDKLNSFSRNSSSLFDSLDQRYSSILISKNRIQEWEDDNLEISDKIQGKENMKEYEDRIRQIKVRLRELHQKAEKLNRDDGVEKGEITRCKKIYDSLVDVSGKNKETMLYIDYAETIRDWLNETYAEKELVIREDLETKVNEIFEQIYHGHRRVSIDSKYNVKLLTTIADKEVASGESEGSNRVKNFAFIAGLVAMAKEKIMTDDSSEGVELSSEPYPLVMDAPFSNADEKHTANISQVLPEVAEQVIMFVMQKDWNYAEPKMGLKVGKKYYLEKQTETYTVLK